jgi:quercetin dioxygenase-like cupin family protein
MRILLVFLLSALSLGYSQTKSFTKSPTTLPQPEIAQPDPQVRLLLSNSQVRVSRIDLEPGRSTITQRHEHDFIVVSLTESTFEFAGPANSVQNTMHAQEIQVMKGPWAYRIVNQGPNPLHVVEIEIKHGISPENAICGLNTKTCMESRFEYSDANRYTSGTLFETPYVKLAKVEIDPNSAMAEHGHKGDHVMIALTEERLTNSVVGGNTNDIVGQPGNATWIEGGIVHRLSNQTTRKVMFLTIECK